ncbi:MAG: glycosyltransferase family 9 protein, partial [Methylophilaceae bacterium]
MESVTIKAGDKLLILCSGSTGNNIFCTPAIRFLRKHLRGIEIDVVALNKLSAEVFEGNPDINHLYVIDKTRKFDELAKKYTKVLCLNINATKKLTASNTTLLLVPPFVGDVARGEQILQFVAGLIDKPVVDEDRKYVICSGVPGATNILDKFAVNTDNILINIHMGCGRTLLHGWKFFYKDRANDVRLWPVENYVKLGNALISRNSKIRIVITGTRNESFLAKSFEKNVPGTINLVGKTSV